MDRKTAEQKLVYVHGQLEAVYGGRLDGYGRVDDCFKARGEQLKRLGEILLEIEAAKPFKSTWTAKGNRLRWEEGRGVLRGRWYGGSRATREGEEHGSYGQ